MDKSFFQPLTAVLNAAWPEVSQIDWSQYCSLNVAPYENDGVGKYTGIIMHHSEAGCSGASTATVGFLPYPARSASTVSKKVRIIIDMAEAGEDCISSMQYRNPDEGVWGGGIRFGGIADVGKNPRPMACAISGLPEIGDHVLMSHLLFELGLVDEQRFCCLRELYICGTREAMAYVGMSDRQYVDLCERIHRIVIMAYKEVGLA